MCPVNRYKAGITIHFLFNLKHIYVYQPIFAILTYYLKMQDIMLTPNCFWRIYITISSKLLRTLNYILFCMEKKNDRPFTWTVQLLCYSLCSSISVSQCRRNDVDWILWIFPFKSDIIDESYISRFYFVSKK